MAIWRFYCTLSILVMIGLPLSTYGQIDISKLYLVHEKEFSSSTFTPLPGGVDKPSPKVGIYTGMDGGARIVLEKPGAWCGYTDIGSFGSPNIPQMMLFNGDVVRIEYSGKADSASDAPLSGTFGIGYYGGGGLESAPNAAVICDGKKHYYDCLVPESGDGKRLTALYVTVRSSGPAGAEFTVYNARVYRRSINNRIDADAILKNPPKHTARVGKHNGAMSILVDNKPITGLGWECMISHNISDDQMKMMDGDSNFKCPRLIFTLGYHLIGLYPPTWLGPDSFDFSYIDSQMDRILKINPDSKVIFQVALDGALWWVRMHPDAAGVDPKGMVPDYLSEEWQKDSADAIRQMIAHVQTSNYADSVIGYEIMNGATMDCNYEVNTSTPRALKRFSAFLKKRYKTASALRKAWNDPSVTFETAKPRYMMDDKAILDPKDPYALLFAPAAHQRYADSQEFSRWVFDQVIIHFCKTVKEATHNRVITGARTGELLYGGWGPYWIGPSRINGLLKCPYFDVFEQWEPYPGRGIGFWGSGAPVMPPHGLADYNKLTILQNDVRPHTGPDMGYGATSNAAETIVLQRRVFLNSMVLGQSPYLWQMSYTYAVPELLDEWRRQEDIYSHMLKTDRRSGAQIAYVFNSDAGRYMGWDPLKTEPTRGFALVDYPRYLWARAGMPYDMILLDKLDKRSNYKIYVFFLTVGLTRSQQDLIDRVVKKNGKIAIFLWADGLVDASGHINKKSVSELCGINVSVSEKSRSWKMNPSQWFTEQMNLKPDTLMGTLEYNEPCDPKADDITFSPSFIVTDPSSRALAYYEKTRDVGIAVKKHRNWTSIYCASMNLVPSVVRYAARLTKAFNYVDTDDITYLNNSFIGLHTKNDGPVKINLPKATALYDVYEDRELPMSEQFSIPVTKMNTYLFYRGTKAEWEKLK